MGDIIKKFHINGKPFSYFIIILFLIVMCFQFFNTQMELYPFSSFGMYREITSNIDMREYQLVTTAKKDILILEGDRRFYLKNRLDKIPFSNDRLFENKIKAELKLFFKKTLTQGDQRVFILKYWEKFDASLYNVPDATLEFPMDEL